MGVCAGVMDSVGGCMFCAVVVVVLPPATVLLIFCVIFCCMFVRFMFGCVVFDCACVGVSRIGYVPDVDEEVEAEELKNVDRPTPNILLLLLLLF
jgi:hypothetical protein